MQITVYNITIKKKDGTTLYFNRENREQGVISYQGAFAVVEDIWGTMTAIPAADIESIEAVPLDMR